MQVWMNGQMQMQTIGRRDRQRGKQPNRDVPANKRHDTTTMSPFRSSILRGSLGVLPISPRESPGASTMGKDKTRLERTMGAIPHRPTPGSSHCELSRTDACTLPGLQESSCIYPQRLLRTCLQEGRALAVCNTTRVLVRRFDVGASRLH